MPQELIDGLEKFLNSPAAADFFKLAEEGQHPTALVISCMDSRCVPATVFNSRPGKFFAHSPMGALVPCPADERAPSELRAKIKYAVDHIGVEDLIVVGHTKCGAIGALVSGLDDEEIRPWINVAQGAFDKSKKIVSDPSDETALAEETERQAVIQSVENLKAYEVVSKALNAGKINVHGWLLNITDGHVYALDQDTGQFNKILFSFEQTDD